MVSAIKRDGQPLYKLARRGIAVEREARPIEVFELILVDWHPPSLTVEVACTPGTYIRALARDLGRDLGCGAHLTTLTRLASGDFTLSDAIELERFASAATAGESDADRSQLGVHETQTRKDIPAWHRLVIPMDAGLEQFPACILGAQESRRVRSGQSLPAELVSAPTDDLCRAYSAVGADKLLLALLRFDDDHQIWRPHKVFHPL
jgi:tRNA pseudouridine55 synthase